MSMSIRRHSSLAPPCAGPQRQAMPAAMQANGLAPDDPAERTVEVDAFCSWSACRVKMRSIALVRTGFGFQSSAGTEKHIRRKFSAKEMSLRGCTNGWPIEYLNARAAIVGIFAIIRCAEIIRCSGSLMLV